MIPHVVTVPNFNLKVSQGHSIYPFRFPILFWMILEIFLILTGPFPLGFQAPGEEVFGPQNIPKTPSQEVFGRLGLYHHVPPKQNYVEFT